MIQTALERIDPVKEDVEVIMEGISSLEIIPDRISIPDPVSDLELTSTSLLNAVYRVIGLCKVPSSVGVFKPLG